MTEAANIITVYQNWAFKQGPADVELIQELLKLKSNDTLQTALYPESEPTMKSRDGNLQLVIDRLKLSPLGSDDKNRLLDQIWNTAQISVLMGNTNKPQIDGRTMNQFLKLVAVTEMQTLQTKGVQATSGDAKALEDRVSMHMEYFDKLQQLNEAIASYTSGEAQQTAASDATAAENVGNTDSETT